MPAPTYSTWPETAYALAMTNLGKWPAQAAVVQLMCAHAQAEGAITGPAVMSQRDLASHLHASADSVSAAIELLDALVERRVLRLIERGIGTAGSEWGVWHWTRWEVPWRVRPEVAAGRIGIFAAAVIRAEPVASARVLIRAQCKVARGISAGRDAVDNELARGVMTPRASSSTVVANGQVEGTDPRALAAQPPAPSLSHLERAPLSPSGSERASEDDPRGDELLGAIQVGGMACWGQLEQRVRRVAAEANGHLPRLVELARSMGNVRVMARRVELLERALVEETPLRVRRTPAEERAFQLEGQLRAGVLAGEHDLAEEVRQQLATIGGHGGSD